MKINVAEIVRRYFFKLLQFKSKNGNKKYRLFNQQLQTV